MPSRSAAERLVKRSRALVRDTRAEIRKTPLRARRRVKALSGWFKHRPQAVLQSAPVQAIFETIAGVLSRSASNHGWHLERRKKVSYMERAERFEYYWYNAAKKIDIREIPGFGDLARKAIDEHRTGMRFDRLYTLWQAVAAIGSDAPIAEVGVYRGGSSRFILEALRFHGRSNLLYACDTFAGHAEVDERLDGPHQVDLQFTNTSLEDVQAYLREFPNVRLVPGDFRGTSAELAAIPCFSLVHIDVDVYPVTRFCLEFFAARIHPGSFIVVDDYGFSTCRGAREAVEEFVAATTRFRRVHLLTGQALLVRVAND